MLVKSLVIEAIRYSVSGVAGRPRSTSARPKPAAHTSSWSWTMPTETPGKSA